MEDEKILALYCARDEAALAATQEKYGGYCRTIAGAVLGDPADAEESVSDALLGAWNAIPPHRPENLRTFLGKLTRRAALKKYRAAMSRCVYMRPLLRRTPTRVTLDSSSFWKGRKPLRNIPRQAVWRHLSFCISMMRMRSITVRYSR